MNDYIKYIINGMMCIAGGILAAVFLVSDRWMRDPNVYSEELGQIVHRFNIGFHWTTLIGMAGVVLFLAGAYHFIKEYLPCALNACFEINDHPATLEELIENNRKWYGR